MSLRDNRHRLIYLSFGAEFRLENPIHMKIPNSIHVKLLALILITSSIAMRPLVAATVIVPPDAFWDVTDFSDSQNLIGIGSKQAPFGAPNYTPTCPPVQPPTITPWNGGFSWSIHKTVDLTGYDPSTIQDSIAADNGYSLSVNGHLLETVTTSGCAAWSDFKLLTNAICGTNDIQVILNGDGDSRDYFAMTLATGCYTTPVVAITSPLNLSQFCGSTMTITAKADEFSIGGTCSGGTITKVEFYQGATKIGEVDSPTTSPDIYSFSWANPPIGLGTYYLTAKVTDSQGKVATSAPVCITACELVRLEAETYSPPSSPSITIPSGQSWPIHVRGTRAQVSNLRVLFRFHQSDDCPFTGYLTDYATSQCLLCNGTQSSGFIVDQYGTGGYDATGHMYIPAYVSGSCCNYGCFSLDTYSGHTGCFLITLLPDDQTTPTYRIDPSASEMTVYIQ